MIAGNPSAADENSIKEYINMVTDTTGLPNSRNFPEEPFSNLAAFLMFPNCIEKACHNEKRTDHTSCTKSVLLNEPCGPGYDRIPQIFLHPSWDFPQPVSRQQLRWAVSEDWGNGFKFHADFMSGWDEQKLSDIIQRCKTQSKNDCLASIERESSCSAQYVSAAKSKVPQWADLMAFDSDNPLPIDKLKPFTGLISAANASVHYNTTSTTHSRDRGRTVRLASKTDRRSHANHQIKRCKY
jgi:hypothetical protein